MASTKDFHDYVVECLQNAGEIRTRKMMGEYILYFRGKVIGGIYDNNLLFKDGPSCAELLPNAEKIYPYEGSKTLMNVIDNFEDTDLMQKVMETLYLELPEKKG